MQRVVTDWLISLACFVATVVLSLVPLGSGSGSPLFGYILDAGHFFFYCFCAGIIYTHFPLHAVSENSRFIITVAVGSLLSATLEFIQPSVGRTASIGDFIASSSGAFFGALCFFPIKNRIVRGAHLGAMIFAGLTCLQPAFEEWWGLKRQRAMFPILASFTDTVERRWWSGTPDEFDDSGLPTVSITNPARFANGIPEKASLLVKTHQLPWHGAILRLPHSSWKDYRNLELELFIEEDDSLHIRIDDDQICDLPSDRFSDSFALHSGWNRITIPLEKVRLGPVHRELDLDRVRLLYIYTSSDSSLSRFLIGKISLN